MINKKIVCKNLKETSRLAKRVATFFKGGEVMILSGDLGAGKTTFTKMIAKNLGVKEIVTSPTFTLMNQYLSGRIKLYHFDMYRIENIDEILETGLTEYFNKSDAVCIIEWAEKIWQLLPLHFIKVTIERVDETTRNFIIENI